MRLYVSREMLRQVFELEAPIKMIFDTNEPDVLAFAVGDSEDRATLIGDCFTFTDDEGQRWHRWQYSVEEKLK